MKHVSKGIDRKISCPDCKSEALYRYGKVQDGLQRVRCILCGRQFIPGHVRKRIIHQRPICPACGKSMHLYRREVGGLRFRCAAYPVCRGYLKVNDQEVKRNGMLRS
jgi:ssDNA-binding Zn-finger/Zn-ribbon topoisomerase 1